MQPQNQNVSQRLTVFGKLIQPSWLSGLTVFFASGAITAYAIWSTYYSGSTLRYIVDAERAKSLDNHVYYEPLKSKFSSSEIVTNIPLFLLWMGVGLIAYYFVTAMARALSNAAELEKEINYVHVDKHQLMREAVLRVVLRVGILIGFIILVSISLHYVIPYVIALAAATKTAGGMLGSIAYTVLAAVLLAVILHLHVITLRLLALRTRIFG